MKYAFLAIATLALFCAPASALTNVSACGSLSGDTQFKLTANLTASTSNCLTITGVTTSLDLNCDGHSITDTGSSFIRLIYGHHNTGVVSFHDCVINGYDNRGVASVRIESNSGNDPNHNYSGPSTWSYSNTYNYGYLHVQDTPYFTSIYDRFRHSYAWISTSDNARVLNGGVDNSGRNQATGGLYSAGFVFNLSDYPYIKDSYVIGNAGTYLSGDGNVDDGILFACQEATNITRTCIGAYAESNTSTDMWDAGVEFTGQWTYPLVLWESDTRPLAAGIACFNSHACSIDHGYFGGNAVVTSTNVPLMVFTAPVNVTSGTFFTNNTIEYNTISSDSSVSAFGSTSTPWDTQSGNVIQNNNFGASALVTLGGSGSGFTDGGGNSCSSATSVITCH